MFNTRWFIIYCIAFATLISIDGCANNVSTYRVFAVHKPPSPPFPGGKIILNLAFEFHGHLYGHKAEYIDDNVMLFYKYDDNIYSKQVMNISSNLAEQIEYSCQIDIPENVKLCSYYFVYKSKAVEESQFVGLPKYPYRIDINE